MLTFYTRRPQHGGDDAAAEAESADYAEHALLSFLFSITADRMPAAAAAAASLWTEHAESLPSLNGLLETQVSPLGPPSSTADP